MLVQKCSTNPQESSQLLMHATTHFLVHNQLCPIVCNSYAGFKDYTKNLASSQSLISALEGKSNGVE